MLKPWIILFRVLALQLLTLPFATSYNSIYPLQLLHKQSNSLKIRKSKSYIPEARSFGLNNLQRQQALFASTTKSIDIQAPGNISIPATPKADLDAKNEKLIDLVVSALADNRENDLVKAGMKVSSIKTAEVINRKLADSQLNEQILGEVDDDQMDIMKSMMSQMKEMSSFTPEIDTGSIDTELLDRIREDAAIAMRNMQENQVSILSSLDKVESEDSYFKRLNDVDEINQQKIQEQNQKESIANESTLKLNNIEALDILNKAEPINLPKSVNENVFSHLLRASLDSAQESAPLLDESIRQNAMNKLSGDGDITEADIKALVGKNLAVMSEELGIDMKEELMADENVKASLQAIMKSALSELASNLSMIETMAMNVTSEDGIFDMFDKTSALLREEELPTAEPEAMSKDVAFQQLLLDQDIKSKKLVESRKQLQESTKRLETIMAEYEYTVPPLTALALFPSKSIDKKAAFVFGLSLFLKVPYDLINAFVVNHSLDPSHGFSLFVQSLLCLALFHHYGLLGAWFSRREG